LIQVDAIVLGAGPAGATVALNLAPFRSVLVVEQRARPAVRIGESLPPAARRLLVDMGLWEGFVSDRHLPCYARRSAWGTPDPVEIDTIRDPDGHGWLLDRARFEARLRATAASRGATILAPAKAGPIGRGDDCWTVAVLHDGRTQEIRARVLIDARGRAARPLPPAAAKRRVTDRLVCGWLISNDPGGAGSPGVIYTEAEAEGWWYSAPLPRDRRIVAFHTDADLPSAIDASDAGRLAERAARLPTLGAASPSTGSVLAAEYGFCAAHTCRLDPTAGDGWLAVGDACLALDPLSSQGLLNALYTGLAAAEAADRILSGDAIAWRDYQRSVGEIWGVYWRRLPAWYRQERRWGHHPFWRRRAASGSWNEPALAGGRYA